MSYTYAASAAAGTAHGPAIGNLIDMGNVRDKGTDTLMSESARLISGHQDDDPVRCLTAWVENNQKNNPYLKTCEASPPSN